MAVSRPGGQQAARNATYEALAAPRPRGTTALRHRLLRLFVRLWWHPYWETAPSVPAARGVVPRVAPGCCAGRVRQGLRLLLRRLKDGARINAAHHAVSAWSGR
ncbi:hypothetical protein B5181_38680 [Streptomyces sp. 4F]|nr:hypothetical protein B5181_38680 [Streptomyces sp. 4F]